MDRPEQRLEIHQYQKQLFRKFIMMIKINCHIGIVQVSGILKDGYKKLQMDITLIKLFKNLKI